jgi:aspartyl aminopeptidase
VNGLKEKTDGELLSEKLTLTLKSCWETAGSEERTEINRFAKGYKVFLDAGKTERQLVENCAALLSQNGFNEITRFYEKKENIKPGTKIYQTIKGSSLVCAIIGKRPIAVGVNIIGAHSDSPHLALKINPLYENSGMAFLDTHYYGGIKYYQWAAIPLLMSGTVIGEGGKKIHIQLGGRADEPVFTITDLLPHLDQEQMKKNAGDFIDAEGLDILAGSEPYQDEKITDKVKLNILKILHEKYGMTEKTFANAEISFVPAFAAHDVGFDRSMIGAPGQDDKSCAYAALQAALRFADSDHIPEKTVVCVLIDKEEEGGYRPQIQHFKNFLRSLCQDGIDLSRMLSESSMISADVNAAYDPNFTEAYDTRTAPYLGKGISVSKSGTGNFADMDFCQKVQDIFDKNSIQWQYGGWGKPGKSSVGTMALEFASLAIDVIDCGIPVLSMHSPFEVISKIDLWTAYKGYTAFLREA